MLFLTHSWASIVQACIVLLFFELGVLWFPLAGGRLNLSRSGPWAPLRMYS